MNFANIFSSYWVRSAFFSILQRFVLILFGFLNFFLLIRGLSIPQMGVWALFLTIVTIFENTKTGLLKNAHIKFVTTTQDNDAKAAIASSSLLINLLITACGIIAIIFTGKQIGIFFNSEEELYTVLVWFIPGLICMIFFSHLEAVQNSHFDFKGAFAGNLVRQVCFFIAIITHFVLKKPLNMQLLGIYQSFSILAGTIVLFIFSKKYLFLKFNPSVQWIKQIINYGGYIFFTGVVSNLYSNIDQFMTAAIIPGSIAFYNAAKRINNFIDIPTYTAADILFPKMSLASMEEGISKIKYFYEKMVAAIFAIIIPISVLVIIFAKPIVHIIAGPAYNSSFPILQAYMIISIIGVIQHQASIAFYSIGKTKLCFILNSVQLLLNLSIAFVCLKLFGFYGAVIGALITALINIIIWMYFIKKEINPSFRQIPVYSKEYYLTVISTIKKIRSFKKPN